VQNLRKNFRAIILVTLLLACIFIWQAVLQEIPGRILTVAFLDVGQGDSIFIESPTHNKLIIDGGPNAAMLSQIGKLMPWYDRMIDVILITHPDGDHYAGFIDLLKRYKVGLVIVNGIEGGSPSYRTLEALIENKKIKKVIARRGQRLELGGGAYLDILFPDRDAAKLETNAGSIISQLVYGSSTVMLTGDSPINSEEFVLELDGSRLKSDILKAGHHGSRTSASIPFITTVDPQYAIISAGLNNSYGHPHKETLEILNELKIETLVTFRLGTIVFSSDGKNWTLLKIK
jgi:competence protein ComEC